MEKLRVFLTLAATVTSWVLALAVPTHDVPRWTPPIISTIALAMLLWFQVERRSSEGTLREQLALYGSLGPSAEPTWDGLHEYHASSGQLFLYLEARGRVRMNGLRCRVEDPDGAVTIADALAPSVADSGERFSVEYPRDFECAKPVVAGRIYKAMWEDQQMGYPGRERLLTYPFKP